MVAQVISHLFFSGGDKSQAGFVTDQASGGAQPEAVLSSTEAPRPVAIAPGEEIEWRVDYLGVKTGRARMVLGKPAGDIWPVIAQAKTEGWLHPQAVYGYFPVQAAGNYVVVGCLDGSVYAFKWAE